MSQKNEKMSETSAAKKAAVLGTDKGKKSRVAFVAMAFCAVLVVGGSLFFLGRSPETGTSAAVAAAQGGEVRYSTALFADGKARFYEYQTPDGHAVRYFVLRSSDGVIRAAFDACDSCFAAGKGYHQDGDEMVCRNCQRRFASVKVNEVKGGCNPAPLRRQVVDGEVVIRTADIAAGQRYFGASRGG